MTTARKRQRERARDTADSVELARACALVADEKKGEEILPTSDFLNAFTSIEDRPWPEYRNGKPITARQLSQLVGPYFPPAVKQPKQYKVGIVNVRGYERGLVEAATARYARPVADEGTAGSGLVADGEICNSLFDTPVADGSG